MKTCEINDIIRSLPKGRTVFHYFKDRYAIELLGNYVGDEGKSIRDIKSSPYGRLLQKPLFKNTLAEAGTGRLCQADVRSHWPSSYQSYRLTLGEWGHEKPKDPDWYQTSIPGKNLVLHLNFNNEHTKAYTNAIHPKKDSHPFTYFDHPHSRGKHHTLAWARMEVDLDRGEALIEEIQSDWLRSVKSDQELFKKIFVLKEPRKRGTQWYLDNYYDGMKHVNQVLNYFEKTVRSHDRIWSEAMLYAAIWFLHSELGINRVFYHTHETGNRLKSIPMDGGPPRSLYTDLPKRFCFKTTTDGPAVVEKKWGTRMVKARKKHPFTWHVMEL